MIPHLQRALERLEANDDEGALEALLLAWRDKHVPAIADIIDRISERLTIARGGPIKAKTVPERTKKWLAVANELKAADLGRLIETPLPGKWRDARPLLGKLCAFPDDPRLAMGLAKIVDSGLFESVRAGEFYALLFRRFDKLLDPRTLPVVDGWFETKRMVYWRPVRELEKAAHAKLHAAFPADNEIPKLTAEEEAAFAPIVALFADTIGQEKTKARGEADFLKAIYEAPDDEGLRQVFADWLAEKGDPRGELMALQQARREGRDTDAMHRKEASLLKKHGKEWAGPLDHFLGKEGRVFDGGFLVEGALEIDISPSPTANSNPAVHLPEGLKDPAWATMRRVLVRIVSTQAVVVEEILNLPAFQWLRAIGGLSEANLHLLASGPPRPRIEELHFIMWGQPPLPDEERAAFGAAAVEKLPNLRHLALESPYPIVEYVVERPFAKKLRTLTLHAYDLPLGTLAKIVEKAKLPQLEEIAVTERLFTKGTHWRLRLLRDDNGRFTKLRGEPIGASSVPSRYALARALRTLEPHVLTEIVIPPVRSCTYDEKDIQAMETEIERFKNLQRVEVAWERLTAKADTRPPLTTRFFGKVLCEQANVEPLLARFMAPPVSLVFDSYAVNRGAHRALPASDTAKIEKVLDVHAMTRTTTLMVYKKGASETSAATFMQREVEITSAWQDNPGFFEEYLAWLVRLLDEFQVEQGIAPFRVPNARSSFIVELFKFETQIGWLTILGPDHESLIPLSEIEKLPELLPWLKARRTKRNLILIAGQSPRIEIPPPLEQQRLSMALLDLFWKEQERKLGYDIRALAREVFDPFFASHGFERKELLMILEAQGHRHWATAHPTGARAFHFHVFPLNTDAELRFFARHTTGEPNADLSSSCSRSQRITLSREHGDPLPRTEAEARRVLTEMTKKVLREGFTWFQS